jgi:hypothetical protein
MRLSMSVTDMTAAAATSLSISAVCNVCESLHREVVEKSAIVLSPRSARRKHVEWWQCVYCSPSHTNYLLVPGSTREATVLLSTVIAPHLSWRWVDWQFHAGTGVNLGRLALDAVHEVIAHCGVVFD